MVIPDSPFWLSGAFSGSGGLAYIPRSCGSALRCSGRDGEGIHKLDKCALEGNSHTSGGRNGAGLLRCAHTASGIPS